MKTRRAHGSILDKILGTPESVRACVENRLEIYWRTFMTPHQAFVASIRRNLVSRGIQMARLVAPSFVALTLGTTASSLAQSPSPSVTAPIEATFLKENDAAMNKMMAGMAIKPSGDVDRDFVNMMVPHHQGAIDMAIAVLRYGHNEQIRRLAQEIVVNQQQEISAMRMAVGDPLPAFAPVPTFPSDARPAATAMERGVK